MQSAKELPPSKGSNQGSAQQEKFSSYSLYSAFGMVIFLVPLIFYLYWNLMYDDWADVGVYSFVAPTMVFGLLIIALGNVKRSSLRPKE